MKDLTLSRWRSSGPIFVPSSVHEHDLVAIKDPTVVKFAGRWHVYATTVSKAGAYSMVYTSFANFAEAGRAPLYRMARTPGFEGYVAAPQLFYFAPQKKWYLVFQSGPPMYSTNDSPGEPERWTAPQPFFASTPDFIEEAGGWLDFWVIADDTHCHLFFSNDHGRWYKSKTTLARFPAGFDEPVVVLEDAEAGRLYEGCNVYKLDGGGGYLALIEAFDASSRQRRYYRSFTAPSLEGPWSPLHADGRTPFAGASNVDFDGEAWSLDISHGELIRSGYDQTLAIDPDDFRLLYQGFDPAANTSHYNSIPWKLGLLKHVPRGNSR